MIKVIVTNVASGQETHSPEYESIEQANAEISRHSSEGNWGKAAHSVQVVDIPAVKDAWGIELAPAVMKTVVIPSEFTVEIVDLTLELERQRINAEALAYLAATDWLTIRFMESGVEVPQDILEARQDARERIQR